MILMRKPIKRSFFIFPEMDSTSIQPIDEEPAENDVFPEHLLKIHDALTKFETECNNRLDELDIDVDTLLGKASATRSSIANTSSNSSCSSIASLEMLNLESARQNSDLAIISDEEFDFNRSINQLIMNIRNDLKTKSSTRRLIGKVNQKFVDSSLQRFSSQVTAMVNQQVNQKHSELEEKIKQIETEIDNLKEQAQKEFAELRAAIKDIQQLQEKSTNENGNKKSLSQKITSPTLIRKDSMKFRRPKSTNKIPSITELMLNATRPESIKDIYI